MVLCFAFNCNHQTLKSTCSFFRFPLPIAGRQFRVWEKLCRRDDSQANRESRLCSCHFVDGRKENGPSIFDYGNKESARRFTYRSPEKKVRKRKLFADSPDTSCNDKDDMATVTCMESKSMQEMETADLRHKLSSLQDQLDKATQVLTYTSLRRNETMLVHYTGLKPDMFDIVLNMCCRFEIKYVEGWNVDSVTKADQLLMALMKLRGNCTHLDLGFRFGVSKTTVKNIVTTWICVLHEILYKGVLVANGIPSTAKNKGCLPRCFSSFSGCRITLDCTEVQCAIPNTSMAHQRQTFSAYKQRNTFKGLIGVAPNGVITFVSSLYPGSTSDKSIVSHSAILSEMRPGDMILADKGFVMQDLLPPGVSLNVPPFLKNGRFTKQEAQLTTTIARARIHVERAIARVKNHEILAFIPKHYRHLATKIFQVCACLVNLQAPILKEIEADRAAENNVCDELFTP